MTFQLRDFQEEALEAIRFGHQEHDSVCIELPTGTGKTIVFTRYAAAWSQEQYEKSQSAGNRSSDNVAQSGGQEDLQRDGHHAED